jgi:hypothetical protein
MWIKAYFDDFGDVAPNSRENMVAISTKKELFEIYEKETRQVGQRAIDYNSFIEIWNALHPYNLIRSWVNPPGKCLLCADIDALRRKAKDSNVKEALRQCHLIHRGGLIFPERGR